MPEPAPITTGNGGREGIAPPPPAPLREHSNGDESDPLSTSGSNPGDARLELLITDRTLDAERRARDLAKEQVRQEQREGSMFNPLNWARKAKLRMLERYYVRTRTEQVMQQMVTNNNSYLSMDSVRNAAVQADANRDQYEASGQAKVQQLKEYTMGDDSATGADRREEVRLADDALKEDVVANILRPIAEGRLTSEADVQQKLREFVQRNSGNADVAALFGSNAKLFASDLLSMGERVRDDIARNRYGIDQIAGNINVRLAKAQWAAQTEVSKDAADRLIDWLSEKGGKHKWLRPFLTPATSAAAVSLATWGLSSAARKALAVSVATNAVVPGAGLLVGMPFAAIRRWSEMNYDRSMHQTERAYGQQIGPDKSASVALHRPLEGRRNKMEKLIYSMASVSELISGGGRDVVRDRDRASMQDLIDGLDASNPDSVQDIMSRIAEIETRIDTSAQERRDIISYESQFDVEQGRLQLVQEAARARLELRRKCGLDRAAVDSQMASLVSSWNNEFATDKKAKDVKFNQTRLLESMKAGVIGGAVGFVVGAGLNQGLEEIREYAGGHADRVTDPEKGVRWLMRKLGTWDENKDLGFDTDEYADNVQMLKDELAAGTGVGIPVNEGEYQIYIDPVDHSGMLLDADGNEISGFYDIDLLEGGKFEITGDLPDEVKEALKGDGFKVTELGSTQVLEQYEVLSPAGTYCSTTTGHEMFIPAGTHWMPDQLDAHGDPESWRLVLDSDEGQAILRHAEFNPDGSLIAGTMDINPDYAPKLNITEQTYYELTGHEAETRWDEIGTHLDHREWYAYNQGGSQGNELRGYTFRKGDTVILDMSAMQTSIQQGLDPAAIDVQQAIAGGANTGFAFRIPGMDGVVFVPDAADGLQDGQLWLDPNDTTHMVTLGNGEQMTMADFTRMVIDQDYLHNSVPGGDPDEMVNIATELYGRRDLFKLGGGTVEYSMLVDDAGETTLKTFATLKGEGVPTAVGGGPMEIELCAPVYGERTVDIPVTEVAPPPGPWPIIPVPIYGRFPLEDMVKSEPRTPEPRRRFEPEPEPEPEPRGPYESPYGDGYEGENTPESVREAEGRLFELVDQSEMLLGTEKDQAKAKVTDYLTRPEVSALPVAKAETSFRSIWNFVESSDDFSELIRNDGTLSGDIASSLDPVIEQFIEDTSLREEYQQVVGKYFAAMNESDRVARMSDEDELKSAILAYSAVRSILSPI